MMGISSNGRNSGGIRHGAGIANDIESGKKASFGALEALIEGVTDPLQREILYAQYAGMVDPLQLEYVARYSDLQTKEGVSHIYSTHNNNRWSQDSFLPLRHLVTVLSKEVPPPPRADSCIYLLGVSPNEREEGIDETNLRMLEFFLGNFAGKLGSEKSLSTTIMGTKIVIPFNGKWDLMDNNGRQSYLQEIRRRLEQAEVSVADSYTLSNIREGDYQIAGRKIDIVTVARTIYPERPLQESVPTPIPQEFTPVLMSYAAVRSSSAHPLHARNL